MDYKLKDKLTASKDFLTELVDKSWLEIEHLQAQIANIDNTEENTKLIQLFKNLLTSYYVFIGGLENLNSEELKYEPLKICKHIAERILYLCTTIYTNEIDLSIDEVEKLEDFFN